MLFLFAKPEFVAYGLLVVVLLGILFFFAEKRSWNRLRTFAESGLLARLTGSHSRRRLWIKNALLLFVVLLLFLSLARPQWGATWEKAETKGIDIMIALDTSQSMLAEDISPNRLERSKLAILDLLEKVQGDRVGLIAFAGNAFLQCPLTLDYQAFRQTLAAVDTNTIPVGGTDVAAAIDEAEAYFEKSGNDRLMILITDGEDLEASGVQRARTAAGKGTRILTVGVGSTEGELIPVRAPDGSRDYLRDASGKPVSTALDESTLRRIAEVSNGLYAPLGPTGAGLERVYDFSLAQGEAIQRQESLQRIPIERYQWVLLLAVVFLVTESLLSTRRRRQNAFTGSPAAMGLLVLGLLLSPQRAEAGPAREAARAYEENQFEESVSLYRTALEKEPEDPRLLYNLGVSQYRAGQFTEAIASFEKALRVADTDLQAKAFHNLGNSRVAYGFELLDEQPSPARDQWLAALEDFDNALALEEGRQDSRQNLQLLQETIERYTHTLLTVAEPPEGGTVTPGGRSFHKVPFPIKATANEGWAFDKWEGDGIENPEEAETAVLMESDTTAAASFAKTWNLIVISEDPSMGTAGESGTYRADEPVPIKAEAEDYFAFRQWASEEAQIADPNSPETEVTLSSDATVAASFDPAFKLSVEIDPEIGGKAGPSGFFAEFSTVPIQAEPRPGFEWIGWVGDGIAEPDKQQTRITLTEDRIAIARMERIWNLVIIPDPEEGGTVDGAGDHPVGSTVEIMATPQEGFTFEGWEGPGVADPTAPATTVTVQSTEHTLVARFASDEEQDQDQDQDQDEEQDQDQEQDEEQDQDQEQENPNEQEEPQEQPEEQEQEQEQQPEPEEQEAQEPEAAPGEMTREEARQLLNALSESERFLPAGERSREERETEQRPEGRNW